MNQKLVIFLIMVTTFFFILALPYIADLYDIWMREKQLPKEKKEKKKKIKKKMINVVKISKDGHISIEKREFQTQKKSTKKPVIEKDPMKWLDEAFITWEKGVMKKGGGTE